ncbi:hypothetical protein AB0F11_24590 [Streptomyces sp. NPDC032472]|uniref:hypothetical protein n=1 Tax=Streptomyces sp. NPDC032472 TaxID=3155018 RepID=UPI0033C54B13
MNTFKRGLAVAALGTTALLGAVSPAVADGGEMWRNWSPGSASVSTSTPNWEWTVSNQYDSNVQHSNGLANIATGGNMCLGTLGVLAPDNNCPSSWKPSVQPGVVRVVLYEVLDAQGQGSAVRLRGQGPVGVEHSGEREATRSASTVLNRGLPPG